MPIKPGTITRGEKAGAPSERFHLILLKPTRYDANGYPIAWYRSTVPSNTMACLYGIGTDCNDRRVLGDDVEIVLHAHDEINAPLDFDKMVAHVKADGGKALVALVGVQTNQFPRSIDIARTFLDAGIPVCMGGFHISGCVSMLDEMPPEMVAAQEMGISFFLGEAEDGRLDEVLRDAWDGKLKPVYDYATDLPEITDQPLPFVPKEAADRTLLKASSFDVGRGCPFECSFCCIINVQGRKSRFRTEDDIERIIRMNHAKGIFRFFITDDNFARNRNWEPVLDRIIELREEGLECTLMIQVDTLCHRIPGFIEKCGKAGVDQVFIGMENINPENLIAIKKRQNRIVEYREMLLAWKHANVLISCSYILGLPADTYDSIMHDVDLIKRELPIDFLYFTILTPLPGSEDHKKMLADGVWMDDDLNKYNLANRVIHHQRMSDDEWDRAYVDAWNRFYQFDHMKTVLRRNAALGCTKKKMLTVRFMFWGFLNRAVGFHSYDVGYLRKKSRTQRRSTMPIEGRLKFYAKFAWEFAAPLVYVAYWRARLGMARRAIFGDPKRREYTDIAITPPSADDYEALALFTETAGGSGAVEKLRKQTEVREKVKVKVTASA